MKLTKLLMTGIIILIPVTDEIDTYFTKGKIPNTQNSKKNFTNINNGIPSKGYKYIQPSDLVILQEKSRNYEYA